MVKPLRVLIIEDSEDDTRLVVRELVRGGYTPTIKRVETAEAMQKALESQKWDVIIADYTLPRFSGIEALRLMKNSGLDLPFIIITGTVTDETCVAAMKAGAHDYIMKDNLKRLVPAVERELKETEVRQQKRQAEEKIKLAAKEWQTTFDSISDWVSVHDKDFKIVRVNKAFADFLKMTPQEIIGKRCHELIHGQKEANQDCSHQTALKTGRPSRREFFNAHLGIYMDVLCSPVFDDKGEIAFTVHICRDITEQKKMQEKLIVTDRLASIGQLASGIAHELNNPLTGIIGFSELVMEKDVPDSVKEDLATINKEAKRAASVVKGLLTFARKRGAEKAPVDINSVIQEVMRLRSYEQRVSNIEVDTRFALDLPGIMGNGGQLQQVFINLIVNAEQAMLEAHNRGKFTIVTRRVGDIVKVSVTDDGPGISPENMKKLFTPFFTTKGVGKGTGLGLSICHGIITEHSGRIYAESELGKGATFIIELPASK